MQDPAKIKINYDLAIDIMKVALAHDRPMFKIVIEEFYNRFKEERMIYLYEFLNCLINIDLPINDGDLLTRIKALYDVNYYGLR